MIVTTDQLQTYLSWPQWSQQQTDAAELLLSGLESELEAYFRAPITPVERGPETARVTDTGLVVTTHPVHQVTSLDGTAITGGDLPDGWRISEHWLRRDVDDTGRVFTLDAPGALGTAGHTAGVGTVTVAYMAGWGEVPALRQAILRKAAGIFANRHDDTLTTRGVNGTEPQRERDDWTRDELYRLGRFRNLTAWR